MSDLSEQIKQTASEPKQATVDGKTFVGQSIQDQIAADRYLASKRAAKSRKRGFVLSKLKPPGTV